MNNQKSSQDKRVALALLASLALLTYSFAGSSIAVAQELQPEKPSLDSTSAPTTVLNGHVSKAENLPDVSPPASSGGQLNAQPPDLPPQSGIQSTLERQGESAMPVLSPLSAAQESDQADLARAAHPSRLITLFLKAMQPTFINLRGRRATMSTEEFRALQYGVIGIDAVARLEGPGPVITAVFPSCPAANAGIEPGDLIVKANSHVFRRGEGQRVMWQVVGGKAGTPVDVTVLRDGQEITFHLTRMNIEDIQDAKIRRIFEILLSVLGPPQ